jgi:large subunit ribosomal protein L19
LKRPYKKCEEKMNLIDVVNEVHANPKVKDIPDFRTGDSISVHARITEGSKSRIQIFQGVCIAIKRKGSVNGHFRVRKVSNGMGVERVFPYHSHNVDKVEIVQRGRSRRAKLYYLRERSGKSARIAIDYDRK